MEGTIGEIVLFAAHFEPLDWAFCDGRLLSINQYTALYAILGNTYGGNGSTTFALPNLMGRSAVSAGKGSGLSPYALGQTAGSGTAAITVANMPAHTHIPTGTFNVPAYSEQGDSGTPAGNVFAAKPGMYSNQASDTTTMPVVINIEVQSTGNNQPISVVQPSIGMNYIICLTGYFPPRN
jgi:microcystin-dependent protein